MKDSTKSELSQNKYFLLVVPVCLFVFMLFRLFELRYFYQGWYDPVYGYLFNGLTFALGSTDIGMVDHPGTPLQLIIAALIKIIALFRGTSSIYLADDVIGHPESYLHIISIFFIMVNCCSLWMLGLFSSKHFQNIPLAILIQLTPLLSLELVKFLPIICCETVIIFSSFALVSLLICDGKNRKNQILRIFLISFFVALIIATKISAVLVLIIPFFFLKNMRQRLLYMLTVFFFILLFILPVFDKLFVLFNFLKGIATHSGSYGAGSQTIIDWKIFFHSFYTILTKDVVFSIFLLLLLPGWYLIFKKKIRGKLLNIFLSVTVVTILQIIVVSRHYDFHYLIPIFAITFPLQGYFWLSVLIEVKALKIKYFSLMIMVLLVLSTFVRLIITNHFPHGIVTPSINTSRFVEKNSDLPYLIIADGNIGETFIEPAIYFGLGYTGSQMRQQYKILVKKYYSGNYLWNHSDSFFDWNKSYLPQELFSRIGRFYIYERVSRGDSTKSLITSILSENGINNYISTNTVFENKQTQERIVLATVDSVSIKKLNNPIIKIYADMENFSSDKSKILSSDVSYSFTDGGILNQKYARSGKCSVMLTPSNPYGLNIALPLILGNKFKVDLWQKGNKTNNTFIVASSKSKGIFYKASLPDKNSDDEWLLNQMTFNLPGDYPEKEIYIYVWNSSKDSVWLDDFTISVFP
jgi:hypothetical protein